MKNKNEKPLKVYDPSKPQSSPKPMGKIDGKEYTLAAIKRATAAGESAGSMAVEFVKIRLAAHKWMFPFKWQRARMMRQSLELADEVRLQILNYQRSKLEQFEAEENPDPDMEVDEQEDPGADH